MIDKIRGEKMQDNIKSKPAEITKHKMISRKQAREYKARAVEFEKTNHRFIFMFPCNGDLGWYEMGDMSAILYSYLVCKPNGYKVELQDDGDSYYDQFEMGRIRTMHLETVERRINESGLFAEKVTKGDLTYFALKKPLKKAEVESLRADEAARQMRINRIVEVADIDAKFNQIMAEVVSRMNGACNRQMDGLARETNGARIMNLCGEIQMAYYLLCDPPKKTLTKQLEVWHEIRSMLNRLKKEVDIAVGMRIWKRYKVVSLMEKIIEAEGRVNTLIARIEDKMKGHSGAGKLRSNSTGNTQGGAQSVATSGVDKSV
ncbi:hypothetical protein IKG68_02365 [Candidatus Saccharibacteria bacterium]|nr:hypothetical protein [Candidatus Saccharibacteria bacterium]